MDGSVNKESIKFLAADSLVRTESLIQPIDILLDGSEDSANALRPYFSFINKIIDADNLIVLAGSGTSLTFNVNGKPQIAPSMADLWAYCKAADAKLFNQVLNAVGYHKVAQSLGATNLSQDIELLLSLCDSHLELKHLSNTRLGQLRRFIAGAKKVIRERTSFTSSVPTDLWQHHDRFIRTLAKRSQKQKRLKLFTTNYDLAFEVAASNTGMIVIDGFEYTIPARFNPAWFNFDIVNRAGVADRTETYLSNVFQLYKIHGSVDWVRGISGIEKRSLYSTNDEPVFIYPSSSKYQVSYETPYLDMMSALLDALQKPKTALLCIGFGFNDKHINNAISMALRTNPEFMVMASTKAPFDEKGSFNRDIRKLLVQAIGHGDTRISIVDSTFDIFSKLLPERHKSTPEDDLFKLFSKLIQA